MSLTITVLTPFGMLSDGGEKLTGSSFAVSRDAAFTRDLVALLACTADYAALGDGTHTIEIDRYALLDLAIEPDFGRINGRRFDCVGTGIVHLAIAQQAARQGRARVLIAIGV